MSLTLESAVPTAPSGAIQLQLITHDAETAFSQLPAEQQEKLRSIAKAAVKDLLPMREKAQAPHERVKGLLTQPKIDRAAIEAFRAEQMTLAEAASKRFAQAVGDVAEVLTPEQRQKVQEHLEWRRSNWRPWHRG